MKHLQLFSMLHGPGRPTPLLRLGLCVVTVLALALAPLPIAAQSPETPVDVSDTAQDVDDDLFGGAEEDPLADDLFGDTEEDSPVEVLAENDEEVDGASPTDSATPSRGVEEIVVQGKAGQGLEADAPVSVTSFDSEDLQAYGVEDVSDLAKFTPNLEIRTAGATTATFFIRGVGLNDFTANAAGSVAVYQDDVALNLPAIQTGQVFDVENVEVLKGPQGSGPGRNASAGVIQVYTRKPVGEFGGNIRFDRGNFGYYDAEGGLELPLLPDVLSTRMAFRVTQRDGLIDNRCGGLSQAQIDGATPAGRPCGNNLPAPGDPGVVPGLPKKFNDIDTWAARVTLRFLPPETDMDWLFNFHGGKIDQRSTVGTPIGTAQGFFGGQTSDGYSQVEVQKERLNIIDSLGGLVPRPCRQFPECLATQAKARRILARHLAKDRPLDKKPFEGDYNLPGFEKQDSFGGFLRGEWEFDAFSLTSISGYENYDRTRLVDADYTSKRNFEFDIKDDAWQFSQDFRLSGVMETLPIEWSAGAYYLMEELDYDQETLVGGSNEIRPLTQIYTQETFSLAGYAGFVWNFLDDFTLDAGFRYNWERKNIETLVRRGQRNVCESAMLPGGGFSLEADCDGRASEAAPTGNVSLKYFFSEDLSAYGKYSRGWKSLQLNVGDGVDNLVFNEADPESIDSFEVGFHGEWFDGRLDLSGAMFWYSYKDYQVFLFTNDFGSPPQRVVRNASDAELHGAELEARVEPIDLLELTLRFSWLESKFLEFVDSGIQQINLGPEADPPAIFTDVPIEYTGNRLPNTPRFTLSGSAQYVIDMGRWGFVVPRYDFTWTDDVFFDPSEGRGAPNVVGDIFLPDYAVGQKAYALHNLRLAYRTPDERIELAGWVRNVEDTVYKTLAFDASTSAGLVGNLVGDPRTYGMSLSVRF